MPAAFAAVTVDSLVVTAGAAAPTFITESPQSVIGVLAKHHPHDLDVLQRNSWIAQIDLLQRELSELEGGWIAFEFAIPRMG